MDKEDVVYVHNRILFSHKKERNLAIYIYMDGPGRGVQPAARGPHAAQDGCECSPTQNHKFT